MNNFLKVNLQLFAEDVDHDDAVDYQDDTEDYDIEDDVEVDEDNVEDDISEEDNVKVAEPQSNKQTPQENAVYKKMRLKAEEEARKKIESEMATEKERISAMKIAMEQKLSESRILDEYMNPKKIYEYADAEGVSEEMASKMLRYEAEKLINAEKSKVSENFNKLQSTKKELQKDKYFHLLENEVDSIVLQNPDIDYKAVYYYQRGLKADELEKELSSKVEKRTIANIHDRARRKSVGGSDGGSDESVSPATYLTKNGMEMSNAFGNDPRDIAKYVKQNTKKKRG